MIIYALHMAGWNNSQKDKTNYYVNQFDALEDGVKYANRIGPHFVGSFLERLVHVEKGVIYIEYCPGCFRAIASVKPIIVQDHKKNES